nr:MAG TPA: hypothetical protein [Caudoviricetes sp.]
MQIYKFSIILQIFYKIFLFLYSSLRRRAAPERLSDKTLPPPYTPLLYNNTYTLYYPLPKHKKPLITRFSAK